jgi:hypothetical protein
MTLKEELGVWVWAILLWGGAGVGSLSMEGVGHVG